MPAVDKLFVGSIPEIYDTYMVPLIFEAYASDIARRVADAAPTRVLETAAGTGVVARALAPLLAPNASYIVSDLNQPMLDRAAARQGADKRIVWQQADALRLPFDPESFDAVACQFGAMFFPDRIAGYREALRVLKRHGRFIFNVWDRIEENDFARIVTDAARAIFPDDPPRFLSRTPHGYHDVALIEADLRASGFTTVDIITLQHQSSAADAHTAALAYCHGTPLRSEIEARDPKALNTVTDRATDAILEAYGEGPVSGNIQAHIIVARA
ncbi:class I SAM-dependent methyltransferase [Rhizobium sp. 18055]|uniref:class I SAM-dependent methyltransferase n=1 Tax=Rhizobium sp. 18055 TaxID=2681403 RepID=UPI00135800EF|nr:methyltransferase domain-containing protein [Rhizobium sp. 18055]